MVSRMMRMPVQANKAIVGKNAFAHSSGIHQDGFLKHRENYEIMNPEDIGLHKSDIILTARSGRHALKHHLERLGFEIEKINLDEIYKKFLEIADQKKEIFDDDLLRLISDSENSSYKISTLHVVCGDVEKPTATIKLRHNNQELEATAFGNGPLDATINAIKQLIDTKVTLDELTIQAIHGGSNDISKVNIKVKHNEKTYTGYGFSTDIVKASAIAFLDALNKFI